MSYQQKFNQLYRDYSKMVYNLCLHYLQNVEEAEEATQDAFLKIYKGLPNFKQNAAHKTWIYRITINLCLDRIKSRNRKKALGFISSLFSVKEKNLPTFEHPGIQLEQKEALERLLGQINSLSGQQKTVIILKYIEDLSMKEIAAVMDKTEKAVESLLSRAKSNLKKKIKR